MLCDAGHIETSRFRKARNFQLLFMQVGVSVNVITAVPEVSR